MKVKLLVGSLAAAVVALAVVLVVVLVGGSDSTTTPVAQTTVGMSTTQASPTPAASPTKAADPALPACQQMKKDKDAGTKADDATQQQEITALTKSSNADLRKAGEALKSQDMTQIADTMSQLYDGCAAIGVPLE